MTGQIGLSTPGIGSSSLTRNRPAAFSRTDVGSLHRDVEFWRQRGRDSFSLARGVMSPQVLISLAELVDAEAHRARR
jgi:hypothetical protein